MLAVAARLSLIAAAVANPAPASLPIAGGRTTTVVASLDVGAPIERAIPNAAYARAVDADADERWDDAQPLYRKAIVDWKASSLGRPSRALDLSIAKAERELRSSQLLAIAAQNTHLSIRKTGIAPEAQRIWERRQALDEGRLLSAKLLATRATLGRVAPGLYTRARNRLEEARDPDPRPTDRTANVHAEVELLLCATYAAGGAAADARLARAHVTEAERADPANAVAVAACAAALGETEAALIALEAFALRPVPGRPERFLRDAYLSNDWDHLRGNPRFESLFPR